MVVDRATLAKVRSGDPEVFEATWVEFLKWGRGLRLLPWGEQRSILYDYSNLNGRDDFIAVARFEFWRAAMAFDESRSVRFFTFAGHFVHNRLIKMVRSGACKRHPTTHAKAVCLEDVVNLLAVRDDVAEGVAMRDLVERMGKRLVKVEGQRGKVLRKVWPLMACQGFTVSEAAEHCRVSTGWVRSNLRRELLPLVRGLGTVC
jgi:DNA-directed RNA polymerase specialized sigma24 family protein